jgi:ABC-type transport system involved in cytochrome c biogenesis permease subunit
MEQDREHLRILAIFHWIVAGLAAICALFPVIHLLIGIGLASGGLSDHRRGGAERLVGWFFILVACALIVFCLAYAVAMAVAAQHLASHRHRTFCLVMAGVSCMFVPFGTVLGIFTILVLSKESVRALFEAAPPRPVTEMGR